jgi:hypothetical protein
LEAVYPVHEGHDLLATLSRIWLTSYILLLPPWLVASCISCSPCCCKQTKDNHYLRFDESAFSDAGTSDCSQVKHAYLDPKPSPQEAIGMLSILVTLCSALTVAAAPSILSPAVTDRYVTYHDIKQCPQLGSLPPPESADDV